jgi:hypothetical protein
MRTLVRDPAWNTTRQRATQVFAESTVCGAVIGGGAAFSVTLVLVLAAGNAGSEAGLIYPVLVGAGGGELGMIVGLLAGVAGLWFVRAVEPGLGARVVAWFLPVVGLLVSLPIALLFALPGDARWRALVLSIATVLSLAGSAVVSYRYLRRAEWPSVH